ncbi:hypothetical protein [Azospirillum doebereinerae]|uniref:DUF2269 family protein n=1 Tax=Azospirillum doebereinerae TaxID=92933 RepID=A0A3S0X7X5_9PROT|nr:hypothetical protein [Azospirillum doebereinerae]MCG5242310.1 hypothetical protein [Azospirillum doebereinerae]RUQ65138.1 hypothetical protein EJ913_25670 [Azospirillum doebereinerae]
MYDVAMMLHRLTAVLAILGTLVWAFGALRGAAPGLTARRKGLYVAAMASTGIAGLTGLAVTFAGPWASMLFPYLGLAAVAGHGVAGGMAKRAVIAGSRKTVAGAVAIQVVMLLVASYLMAVKPF